MNSINGRHQLFDWISAQFLEKFPRSVDHPLHYVLEMMTRHFKIQNFVEVPLNVGDDDDEGELHGEGVEDVNHAYDVMLTDLLSKFYPNKRPIPVQHFIAVVTRQIGIADWIAFEVSTAGVALRGTEMLKRSYEIDLLVNLSIAMWPEECAQPSDIPEDFLIEGLRHLAS